MDVGAILDQQTNDVSGTLGARSSMQGRRTRAVTRRKSIGSVREMPASVDVTVDPPYGADPALPPQADGVAHTRIAG